MPRHFTVTTNNFTLKSHVSFASTDCNELILKVIINQTVIVTYGSNSEFYTRENREIFKRQAGR